MKIPTYQSGVAYRQAHARNVPLTPALPEASGKAEWANIQSFAGVVDAIFQAPMAAVRFLDAYKEGNKAWKDVFNPDDETGADKPKKSEKTKSYTGFDDGSRKELLNYGRRDAWQANQNANPLERLDEYFEQAVQSKNTTLNYQPEQDLLSQDYVILRREMQTVQDKQLQEAAQKRFESGVGTFVQTAALVRSAKVLDAYMEANLEAAQTQARQNGMSAEQWKAQEQTLQQQAVLHNISAALSAGESKQAESVLEYFKSCLKPEQLALAQGKLYACQTASFAQSLYPQAWQECVEDNGLLNEDHVKSFVQSHTSEKTPQEQADIFYALLGELRLAQRVEFKREAQLCQDLLMAAREGRVSENILLASAEINHEKIFQRYARVFQELKADKNVNSNPAAFNQIYAQIIAGEAKAEELERGWKDGSISAADYLRLQHAFCMNRAQESDPMERLLLAATDKFCQESGLSASTAEEVKYFVFSAGLTAQDRLAAACRAREIFSLQEKKK